MCAGETGVAAALARSLVIFEHAKTVHAGATKGRAANWQKDEHAALDGGSSILLALFPTQSLLLPSLERQDDDIQKDLLYLGICMSCQCQECNKQ